MNVLSDLLSERYIIKNKNRELYYQLKDRIPEVKDFISDKLGYRIIQNQTLIKLEKLPGEADGWMGIQEFESIMEYKLFCTILMFLEDKDAEEQFVLSQLTEYILANYPSAEKSVSEFSPFQTNQMNYRRIDWTVYDHRRRLVRVMKYCIRQNLFFANDGNEEGFQTDIDTEVLYENTGVSKYFTRNFTQDISGYQQVSDFFQSEWMDMNEDRGIIRRQRVYRKLLLSMGVYKSDESDEDFAYIKQYHNIIESDFEKYVNCSLQIHKSSAYLILSENSDLGNTFPANNSLSDAILLFFSMLREKVDSKEVTLSINEIIEVSMEELEFWLKECKSRFGYGFSKKYREETSETEFIHIMRDALEQFGMIRIDPVTNCVKILPIAGKIAGAYIQQNS